MADQTGISWADSTFNPWIGCTKVSPGCDHCYAEVARPSQAMKIAWGPGQPRHRTAPATWRNPIHWNKAAEEFHAKHGRRRRVFCASLADVFDNEVPQEWRIELFDMIEKTPNLDWLILTKRIGNVAGMLKSHDWCAGQRNVWLGISVVNQEEADRDIPKLLSTPAQIRWLSCEPMLGAINVGPYLTRNKLFAMLPGFRDPMGGVDWVVAGGESGLKARPMHPEWPRALRGMCSVARVPFLFKQWGEWGPTDMEAKRFTDPFGDASNDDGLAGTTFGVEPRRVLWPVKKIGKKAAGNKLDGEVLEQWPR